MGHPRFVLNQPGHLVAMREKVIERPARPGHGEAETFFGSGATGRILGALVKTHHNIGAERDLDVDGVLGGKEVRAPVKVRAEADSVVGDFAERAKREDLKSAGISEDGARPTDEAMQAAHAADQFVAGAEIKMVGVAEDNLRAEGFERVLGDSFDGALRADGHEDGGLDGAVRQMELGAAAAGCCFRKNLEE